MDAEMEARLSETLADKDGELAAAAEASGGGRAAAEARRVLEEVQEAERKRVEGELTAAADKAAALQALLDAPRKRAEADEGEPYVVRRVNALLWRAESLVVGPMGRVRVYHVPAALVVASLVLRRGIADLGSLI